MGKRLQNQKGKKMSNRIDLCDLCGSELEPGTTTLEVWRGEQLIVIRDVPADVCQQCKEAYISANVSERLDRFLEEYHRHRPEQYLAVPQYSAAQAMDES
jgi:YgiT-type zinc finger domain-containing protein